MRICRNSSTCCYCTSKTRKSESNSQHIRSRLDAMLSCYCTSKTRKSESNSQLTYLHIQLEVSCYCTSKTRKSESNSQHPAPRKAERSVVIALVKLENLKAIHNVRYGKRILICVVIALVKLENLKAIHNLLLKLSLLKSLQ